MQSSQETAQTQPDSREHGLAGPWKEAAVKTIILDDKVAAKRATKQWAREKEGKAGSGVWMWWKMALKRTMGEWEPWRCISTEMVGQSTTATLAKEEWRCWTQSYGHLELYFESPRIHCTRANIHQGRVQSQTDIRVTMDGEGTVGGRQVQQALQLLTERQGRKQETHPNDKREVIGNQVLKSKDRACTQRSIPEMLQTPRR
jgi:hypothetical protein